MTVEYSAKKVDLYTPARRGRFFENVPPANLGAVCAEMSRLAYCRKEHAFGFDRDVITEILKSQGFTEARFFESKGVPDGGGTHCFLAIDKGRKLAIVAFRGTDSSDPTDLWDDAYALQVEWLPNKKPSGKVHAGFAHALAHVQDELLAALDTLTGCETILFTGHSLGAALATLLASLRKPSALYTIGSPRVGDHDFAKTLDEASVYRYVDCCDLVTRVPPEKLFPNDPYAHIGKTYYIDRAGTLTVNPVQATIDTDRLHAAAEYLAEKSWIIGNVGFRELADHSPINYVAALK